MQQRTRDGLERAKGTKQVVSRVENWYEGSGAFVDSSVENKKGLTFTDKLSTTLIRAKVLFYLWCEEVPA